MRMPLNKPYTVGDGFGPRNINVPGASKNHQGQDWGVPVGTPVYAPLDGEVFKKGTDASAGNYLILQHGKDWRTRFNHLLHVPGVSGTVREGSMIAFTGGMPGSQGAGASGGPHLHFAVYRRNALGLWVATDPNVWLSSATASLPDNSTTKLLTEGNEMDFRFKEHGTNGTVFYYNNALDKVRACSPEEIELLRDTAKTWPSDPAFQVRELGASMYKRYTAKARYKG